MYMTKRETRERLLEIIQSLPTHHAEVGRHSWHIRQRYNQARKIWHCFALKWLCETVE